MDEIKVKVIEYADRSHYLMAYKCPLSGKRKWKATEVARDGSKKARAEAEREAGKWQAELREGRYKPKNRTTWAEFRERYEDEVLPKLSKETEKKVQTAFGLVEEFMAPKRVADLTTEALSRWMLKIKN